MADTLLLDTQAWDLVLDINSNIALASEPYSLAQDAASAIKTFQGEVYYNTLLGVPYFGSILGKSPPITLLKAQFVAAAETVPDVTTATCFISAVLQRVVSGQVQITSTSGQTAAANFTTVDPQGP